MALEIGRSHSVGPQGVVADQVVNPADGSGLIRTLADLKSEIARLRINSSSETENPKCPKVPKSLLPSAPYVSELFDDHHYEPVVMSFGPYHHGNLKLVRGEKIKLLLAVDFFDVLGRLLPRRNDDQPLEQRVDMPLDQSVDQPVDKPVDQPVDQALDQPVHQPVDKPVDQSVDQPVDHPLDHITENVVDQLYGKIRGLVDELEGYYDGELMDSYSDEQFSVMMLVDGCALLWYILCVCSGGDHEDYNIRYQDLSLIHQDALLLENQLPYQLLFQDLLKMREPELTIDCWRVIILEFFGMIEESFFQEFFGMNEQSFLRKMKNYCCALLVWITQIINRKSETSDKESKRFHHLLDLYRNYLLGPTPKHTENGNSGNENGKNGHKVKALVGDVKEQVMASFRNVKELMAAGIRIKPSPTHYLRDISFTSNCVTACLRLPPITIDKSTKTLFFNLIAYEMSSDVDHHFISYLRFLDSLIDHADDVKELQSAGVLQNNLGTHEEVAEFFNTVSADLESNFLAYKDVRVKIRNHLKSHYNSRLKMWMTQCLDTYFGSPWTIIAWVGVALALFFTAVQTYFTVFPR